MTARFPHGGGESFLAAELQALAALGHDVIVVPVRPRGAIAHEAPAGRGWQSFSMPLLEPRTLASVLQHPQITWRALRRLSQDRHPRHLLQNLAVVPKCVRLCELAREQRVEHIHAHWAAAPATLGMLLAQATGIPWSFTAHRWDIYERNLLQAKLDTASFARFISTSGITAARRLHLWGLDDKAVVIHMGVDTEDLRPVPRVRGDGPLVFCPANLVPVKGHRYLIEALARLRTRGLRTTAWLAGSGPLRADLERRAARLGVADQCEFLGHLTHERILDRLRTPALTAVVLPSLDLGHGVHEGIPVSLIEAMATGLPVVTTPTGGIPELVNAETGFLTAPGDPDALAEAIAALWEDSRLFHTLGTAARSRIEQAFSAAEVGRQLTEHFAR